MPSGFLQLATRDYPGPTNYRRGDIMSAVPYVQCRKDAADVHCFKRDARTRRFARINAQGFLDQTDVLVDYGNACCEFRFERVSRFELEKVRLSDGARIRFRDGVIADDFDGQAVVMHVQEFFYRQITTLLRPNARGKPMFGTDPHKLWYFGGTETYENPNLDTVWSAVASKLQVSEPADLVAEFSDYRKTVAIPVDDFDHQTAADLMASQYGPVDRSGNREMVAKRNCYCDYRLNLGLTVATVQNIEDKTKAVDLRRRLAFPRTVVVSRKS